MKKQKIRIRTWIIFTEFGINAIPYILDLSNEDVNDDEIALCIQEQVYGDLENKTKSKKGWGRSYGY